MLTVVAATDQPWTWSDVSASDGQADPAQCSRATAIPSIDTPVCFVEPDESFLAQSIRGLALSVATFGVYSFWVRAEARRQLHRSIRIGGEPLDYTGSGGEAFVSFTIAAGITITAVAAFLHYMADSGVSGDQVRAAVSDFRLRRLFISLPLLFLLGSVAYRKRKGMLRRTWWRGSRFDLVGAPYAYAAHHFWTAFLVPLTLGWAAPWRAHFLESRKISEMAHGEQRFTPNMSVRRLYWSFAKLWFGGGTIYVTTMIALGLFAGDPVIAALSGGGLAPLLKPGVWQTVLGILGIGLIPVAGFMIAYQAAWIEHQVSHITVDGVRLAVELPRVRFIALVVGCSLLKVLTVGTFQPVAQAALARFVTAHIRADRA